MFGVSSSITTPRNRCWVFPTKHPRSKPSELWFYIMYDYIRLIVWAILSSSFQVVCKIVGATTSIARSNQFCSWENSELDLQSKASPEYQCIQTTLEILFGRERQLSKKCGRQQIWDLTSPPHEEWNESWRRFDRNFSVGIYSSIKRLRRLLHCLLSLSYVDTTEYASKGLYD